MALVGDWKSQHFLWCRQMPRFLSSPPLPQPPPPNLFNNLDFLVGTVCLLSLRLQTRVELLHWVFTECPDLVPAGESIAPMPGLQSPGQALTASSFWEDISFPGFRNPLWQNSWI